MILKEMGYKVTGSDEDAYPPGATVIDRGKIRRFGKYSPSNLEARPDLVIIGNHVKGNNPEVREAMKRKLKIFSLPRLIGEIFARKKSIVIAGTHGKTTTTALISWILESAGLSPSYLIGGIMRNTQRGFNLGKGDFFVIEGDEYRTAFFDKKPKFFYYKPKIAVLNNCEFDHPDYFKDIAMVKNNFFRFLKLVPKKCLVVGGVDDPNVAFLFKKIKRPKISYGLNKIADYQGFDFRFGKKTMKFKVRKNGNFFGEFKTFLTGEINVKNTLAGITIADYLGIELEKIQKGVMSFRGVDRRFEVVSKAKGIIIIDDYAHHPTKIKGTLSAAKTRYRKNKIFCVFEPHTYSRTRALLSDYAQSFRGADEVIVAKLMPAREKDQKPTITSQEVVKEIGKYNKDVKFISKSSEIMVYLALKLSKGDVVIVMSVGGMSR